MGFFKNDYQYFHKLSPEFGLICGKFQLLLLPKNYLLTSFFELNTGKHFFCINYLYTFYNDQIILS